MSGRYLQRVYQKFGEVAEAAQLLETELGTLLLIRDASDADLFASQDPEHAAKILGRINRSTLGRIIRDIGRSDTEIDRLEQELNNALQVRNRLFHSFYRDHNFRRNSSEGCALMMSDLEESHDILLSAYKSVMLLSGVDLDNYEIENLPTGHVKI